MNSFYPSYRRHRFPAEIISHCVWLYFRFSLSYRDVEEMMAKRGVILNETVREWCLKFGGAYAKRMRSRSPRPGDHWHLDEVFSPIDTVLQDHVKRPAREGMSAGFDALRADPHLAAGVLGV